MAGEGGPNQTAGPGARAFLVVGALFLVSLSGCGDERAAPVPGAPAPVGSLAAVGSPVIVGDVLAEGRALGLETLALPAPGSPEEELEAARTAARPIPEPAAPIARETPAALLFSARALLAARDPAALARLVHSPAARPVLTEDDAAEARRRFLGPRTRDYWARLLGAAAEGGFTVVREDAGEALLRVEVGGAAGAYLLRLRREGDGWFLVG